MTEKNRTDIGNDGGRAACLPASIMVAGQVNGSSGNAVSHAIVTRERDLRNDMSGRFFRKRNGRRQQGFRSLR